MKCYYYGEPSKTLVKAAFKARDKSRWMKYPAACVMVICWAVLVPLAFLMVMIGERGHDIAGWCGWESRNW